jgi:hypothetical protein
MNPEIVLSEADVTTPIGIEDSLVAVQTAFLDIHWDDTKRYIDAAAISPE